MYTVAVQRELIAQHFLIGGDFGPENLPHSHHYRVEVRLAGGLQRRNLANVTVAIWESDVAWAAFTEELTCP
jgi:6-pyruvoyl-tetrahydropterin synthase